MNKDMVKLLKRVLNSLRSRKAGDMVLLLLLFFWGVGAGCAITIMMSPPGSAVWGCVAVVLLIISVAWIKELIRVGAIKE